MQVMNFARYPAAICLLLTAAMLAGCHPRNATPAKETIGHHISQISVRVGGTWRDGYAVHVAPGEYAVVEHRSCPQNKKPGVPKDVADGICVVRITNEQSKRFEAAVDGLMRNAIPLQSYSFEDPHLRPDGKPCRSKVTDAAMISLIRTGTAGAQLASFYAGCDREEFGSFYEAALSVTDSLPIQQIIGVN